MFNQVSSILLEALTKIEQVYVENSVKFPIKHQLETLTRIITPIELKGAMEQKETFQKFRNNSQYNYNESKPSWTGDQPVRQPEQVPNEQKLINSREV